MDHELKCKTTELLEENTGENLQDLEKPRGLRLDSKSIIHKKKN
jgi:hypothetical protein